MNYIQALVARNSALEAEVAALREAAFGFKAHLTTNPKFIGDGPDASRKDWISTSEALLWLRNIETVEG